MGKCICQLYSKYNVSRCVRKYFLTAYTQSSLMAGDTGSYFIDNTDYDHLRAITAASVADSVLGLLLEM